MHEQQEERNTPRRCLGLAGVKASSGGLDDKAVQLLDANKL